MNIRNHPPAPDFPSPILHASFVVTVRKGRFRIEKEYDPSVRVPDDVLKCVGFIGEVAHQDSSGVSGELCATGFFVAIPWESRELSEMRTCYFVTAKHVATDLGGRQVFFLVNAKSGGVVGVAGVIGEHWFLHPTDQSADVAVIQILMDSEADFQAIALEHFGLPERLERLHIGIGDETIITGLFTAVPGTTRNNPIVRHGNIAMMPGEQIQTDLGYADVFLVEARSIGGLSGSPVFARHTLSVSVQRQRDGEDDHLFANGPGVTLLGLMHGHWDIKESEMNKPSIIHDRQRGVNLGIGIVVPAIKIYETLYSPRLIAMRKEQEKELLKRNIPGTDSAKLSKAAEQPFTQATFEAALKKVSCKKQ